LTDVLIPTSAVYYSEAWGWTVADRILDRGPFGVTLAIAVSGEVRYYNFKFLVGYSVRVNQAATSTQVEERTSSAQVGQMAPDFTLSSLIGSKLSLADLRGKVVVLVFWASRCAPSRATMPSLEALVARYRDRGVVLVGVSLDRTAEEATAYLKESGLTQLVALWGSFAEARDVASRYNVFVSGGFGTPHTFIIDRQGIVRFSGHPATLTDETLRPWL
jgi:peroxiredoxin